MTWASDDAGHFVNEMLAVVDLVGGDSSSQPRGQLFQASAETQASSSSSTIATFKALIMTTHGVNLVLAKIRAV